MSHTPEDRPRRTFGQPSVVVKLREPRNAPLVAAVAPPGGGPGGGDRRSAEPLWERVRQRYPGATIERALTGIDPEQVARLQRDAGAAARGAVPDLNTFYRIKLPARSRGAEVVDFVQTGANRDLVESAYVDAGVIPARINPTNDPRFSNQHYVRGRRGNRRGIYANFAWEKPGGEGDGAGIVFVEFGWQLNHEDLAGGRITLISGINGTDQEHGTNCVGEVVGQDNDKGIVGVAPKARARVVSVERTAGNFNTAAAILHGILAMAPGDVMSISLQTGEDPLNPYPATGFRPIEVNDLEFAAIALGTLLGRIICTAAGNGRLNLDNVTNGAGKFVLRRGHADFRDSRAIVVGAATETRPHDRVSASNFGVRVDCFAQGQRITTTSTTAAKYIDNFSNTSGATPIVAGAAALTQSMAKARTGSVLSVAAMRGALAGLRTSIRSRNPTTDRIGRMPNMHLIFTRFIETLRRPAAARTHGLSPVEPLLYVDAGHGGDAPAGQSTAYGGSGALGVYEKDIALDIARRVKGHYGGACRLSRDGDYNLSLQRRAEDARRSGASAFVSVHANSGIPRNAGPEVWLYGNTLAAPDPHSASLAESIGAEIAKVYGGPVPIREGRLSLLDPRLHRPNVAACLVEAGSLSDPADERRLVDAGAADVIGAAVARGVHRYIGTVDADADEAPDTEDTQYETVARGSAADEPEYPAEPEQEGQDVAQAHSYDPALTSGDSLDYDTYS